MASTSRSQKRTLGLAAAALGLAGVAIAVSLSLRSGAPAPAPRPAPVEIDPERIRTVASGCRAAPAAPAARSEHPDVVLITIDTLRADRLGTYGYAGARTPRMDALAAAGVRFDNATTPLPRTTPAMASMLTGLEPRHHGSREVGSAMTSGTSLATHLCRAGYATLGLSGTPVLGPRQGLDQGFQKYTVIDIAVGYELTTTALRAVAEVDPERPLFLWVHYVDPHYHYRPPAHAPQPEAPACRELMKRVDRGEIRRGAMYANRDGVAEAARGDCSLLYDAEVAYADTEVAALLDGLDEHGRLDGAHVILSSDHGENLGEAGLYYEHGPSVHEASLRIPLLWAGPGVARGHVVARAPVQLQDIPPTLLALLGIAPAPRSSWDGVDLSGLLRGQEAEVRGVAFAESASALHLDMFQYISTGRAGRRHCVNDERYSLCFERGRAPQLYDHQADPLLREDLSAQHPELVTALRQARKRWPPEEARERTARDARFKLVEYPVFEGGYVQRLYDLRGDPGETTSVLDQHPEVARRLAAALQAWTEGAAQPAAAERDQDTIEKLRALGYVE